MNPRHSKFSNRSRTLVMKCSLAAWVGLSLLTSLHAGEDAVSPEKKLEDYKEHLRQVIRDMKDIKLDATNSIPKDWSISDVRSLLAELKKAKRIGVPTLKGIKYMEGVESIMQEGAKEPELVIVTEQGEEGSKYGSIISLRLVRGRFAVIDTASFEE